MRIGVLQAVTTHPSWVSLLPVKYYTPNVSSTAVKRLANTVTHDIHVAELVQPEIVRRVSGQHEIPLSQVSVDLSSGSVELVQNPFLHQSFISSRLIVFPLLDLLKHSTMLHTLAEGWGTNSSSSLSIANLVALKILLQNFLYPSTRKISRLISRPKIAHSSQWGSRGTK